MICNQLDTFSQSILFFAILNVGERFLHNSDKHVHEEYINGK
jgi:hypothetical protein